MRSLKRNQQKIYYKTYTNVMIENEDEYGNKTGSYTEVYSPIKSIFINVSASKGNVSEQTFGTLTDYDRTMSISDVNCEIDENSILWVGISAENETPHNYVVKKVSTSLNEKLYAIKQVTVKA